MTDPPLVFIAKMSQYSYNTTRPILSICIPTFDRYEYLDYLLSNILEQTGPDSETVQVVVSDNFSQDSTWSVVDKYQQKSLNLKYSRNYKNIGFTHNLNTVIANASAKFCWLMGDDDALRPGVIPYITEALKIYNPDVVIANRVVCNLKLEILYADNFLPNQERSRVFDFGNRGDIVEYFSNIRNTMGMFNFISSILVKKDCWLRAPEIPGYSNSLFPHVFKVVDILRNQQGRLLYLPEAIVLARTENDRLGEVHQGSNFMSWQLHFKGNIEVADHYFSDDQEVYDAFLQPIKGIIAKGKEHYVNLAQNDGFTDEAFLTLKKLKIN